MPARILIIEDDPASMELTRYLLESAGHKGLCAVDGGAGLEAARTLSPDLLICDLQLPVLSGYGIVRALQSDPSWRRVPIVAVTAMSMPGDREKTLAVGFDGFITKPIVPETFVAEIEAFLPAEMRGIGR